MCHWEVSSVGVTAAVYAPAMAKRATVLWDIQRGCLQEDPEGLLVVRFKHYHCDGF
jgi:hypothetical protein